MNSLPSPELLLSAIEIKKQQLQNAIKTEIWKLFSEIWNWFNIQSASNLPFLVPWSEKWNEGKVNFCYLGEVLLLCQCLALNEDQNWFADYYYLWRLQWLFWESNTMQTFYWARIEWADLLLIWDNAGIAIPLKGLVGLMSWQIKNWWNYFSRSIKWFLESNPNFLVRMKHLFSVSDIIIEYEKLSKEPVPSITLPDFVSKITVEVLRSRLQTDRLNRINELMEKINKSEI